MNRRNSPPLHSARLLDQVRERARYLHYSLSTEKAYLYWIRFFVRWHGLKHPRDMSAPEVEAFLTMLATQRRVSSSTHNQALSSLLFLYREVLGLELPWMDGITRPSYTRRIPTVLTREEVASLLGALDSTIGLVAHLLYGTGMRLMEGLRLRVKDVDFDRHVIVVREAKGNKDRVVMLPRSLAGPLRAQMLSARARWEEDRRAGRSGVEVPHALETKYPKVGQTWGWFWLFPSPTLAVDSRTGIERRHHLYEDRLPRAIRKAVKAAGGTTSPLDGLSPGPAAPQCRRKRPTPEVAAARSRAAIRRLSWSLSKMDRCPGSRWTGSRGILMESRTAFDCRERPPSLPTKPNRSVHFPR